MTASRLILSSQGPRLTGYSVYDLKVSNDGETYTFDYINSQNAIKRIAVTKADLANPRGLDSRITPTDLKITDLAADQIAQKYRYLSGLPVSKVETGSNGLYIIYFGNSYSVSVEFSGNQFIIN